VQIRKLSAFAESLGANERWAFIPFGERTPGDASDGAFWREAVFSLLNRTVVIPRRIRDEGHRPLRLESDRIFSCLAQKVFLENNRWMRTGETQDHRVSNFARGKSWFTTCSISLFQLWNHAG
jgi:hypothetical protein